MKKVAAGYNGTRFGVAIHPEDIKGNAPQFDISIPQDLKNPNRAPEYEILYNTDIELNLEDDLDQFELGQLKAV